MFSVLNIQVVKIQMVGGNVKNLKAAYKQIAARWEF